MLPALLQLHPVSITVSSVGPPLRGHFGSSGFGGRSALHAFNSLSVSVVTGCLAHVGFIYLFIFGGDPPCMHSFQFQLSCLRLPCSCEYQFWREFRSACIFFSVLSVACYRYVYTGGFWVCTRAYVPICIYLSMYINSISSQLSQVAVLV